MKEKKKIFQSSSIQPKENELEKIDKSEEIEKIYRENLTFEHPKRERPIVLVLVLAVIFGLLAGIVGEIVFKVYLSNLPFFGELNLSSQIPFGQEIVIKEPKKVVVEQDLRVNQALETVKPALVSIYLQKNQKTESGPLEKIYLPSEFVGQGFILTSDGWIVTNKEVINDFKKKYLVFTSLGKEFTPSEFILDSATNLVFLKIEAKDLPVVKFGDLEKLNLGQLVLVPGFALKVTVANIEALDYQNISSSADFILSSEKFSKYILIKDSLNSDYLGAPLINLAGEIIGVMTKNDLVGLRIALPINDAEKAIASVLKNKTISRPYLGLHYLDLSKTFGLDESITLGKTKGALIQGSEEVPALEAASPAQKSGLKKGDIILKVEENEINSEKNLTELIQEYKPGEIINLTILRNKEEKVIKAELGEIK